MVKAPAVVMHILTKLWGGAGVRLMFQFNLVG